MLHYREFSPLVECLLRMFHSNIRVKAGESHPRELQSVSEFDSTNLMDYPIIIPHTNYKWLFHKIFESLSFIQFYGVRFSNLCLLMLNVCSLKRLMLH